MARTYTPLNAETSVAHVVLVPVTFTSLIEDQLVQAYT